MCNIFEINRWISFFIFSIFSCEIEDSLLWQILFPVFFFPRFTLCEFVQIKQCARVTQVAPYKFYLKNILSLNCNICRFACGSIVFAVSHFVMHLSCVLGPRISVHRCIWGGQQELKRRNALLKRTMAINSMNIALPIYRFHATEFTVIY